MADDVMHILGRLEGKMDGFLTTINRHEKSIDTLDKRVDSLEQGRARALGVASGVSAILGLCGGWMAKKLGIG